MSKVTTTMFENNLRSVLEITEMLLVEDASESLGEDEFLVPKAARERAVRGVFPEDFMLVSGVLGATVRDDFGKLHNLSL